jgi:hypothetical protein
MTWFADKLGPQQAVPPARDTGGRRPAANTQQTAPRGAKSSPSAAPAPDKKKKKGWF